MPRKAAAAKEAAADGAEAESAGPARRSTRISSKPTSSTAAAAAKEKAKPSSKGRKRKAAADNDGDDGEDDGEEENGKSPRKRKVKSAKMIENSDDEAEADGPVLNTVDLGDFLPADFKLKNEKDEDITLADLGLGDDKETKGVVLFLVPKADTPGCTTQACSFRDNYPDFSNTGFQVYCLSADKPAAQDKWKIKKELPYPLLSDPSRTLIAALGADGGGKTKRSHFVFTKEDGKLKLVEKKIPVKAGESAQLALDFIKTLDGAGGPAVENSDDKTADGGDAEGDA